MIVVHCMMRTSSGDDPSLLCLPTDLF